ncbi:MAG: PIG-L family deacetylase [Phycisphaerales bacterium]|nr:PIG-L family deacetylase [Phycisphaerales bacterium]
MTEPARILVIAPHPDDEVLGVGGTIRRLVDEGCRVTVAIATVGWAPLYPDDQVARVRAEAGEANRLLGVHELRFLDLPVTKLDRLPRHEINAVFDRLVTDVQPRWVFLPFAGDRHEDHRQVFEAAQVALRPVAARDPLTRIWCYETVSETHWAVPTVEPTFQPQAFMDVSAQLAVKLQAMRVYASQLRTPPDARAPEAVAALARWRGSVAGMNAAEAFVVVRERWIANRLGEPTPTL